MNDIGLVLTADARAMIKALKDAEGSLKTFSVKTEADLMKMQKAAKETDKALAGMGQGLSTSQVNKGLSDMNRNLTATGQTAKQTAAALRGVPAQITDIVVSLQGGQNPMTVFLQQGGQLKDMFGGVVPAARALATSLIGMINPVTLAVGAFVALAAAVRAGNQEQQAFRMAIANTGNAAGVTVDQMNGMAEAMGEGFGKTAGKARDALTAMASTGQVARADLQQFAQVAIDVERVTGQSLEKTAENFAALGKDPLGASLRLSETMNYLTVETYKQIKAAQDLGNTQQAAAIAQQAYADAEEARITRAVEGVGYMERAWKAVTGAAVGAWNFMKEAWDWLKSIGRDAPVQSQIADIRKELDLYDKGLRNLSGRQVQAYKDQLANLQEVERMSKRAGDAEAERVAANAKGIKALIEEEKNASKVKAEADRKAREAEAARKEAAREAAKERQKELDVGILRNKLVEENAKRELKLAQDTQKAYEDGLKPYLQAAKAAEDRVKSLETEEDALKISKSMNVSLAQAVEMVNIAKLKERQIDAMGNEDAVAAIQTEIEAREKLVGLIGDKEARDASSKAAEKAATDWQRAAEKIQDSITDALMRGFESGKGAAQVLKDTVINMFKTMVLRPVIQGIVGGVTGMGASAAGASGIEGIASSMAQKYITSAITGSILGSSAAYGAAIGTTSIAAGSQAAMLAAQTGSFGAAGLSATASAAGTGSSLMASAAAAGPYVAAAVLALNALGVFRSNKVVGGGISGTLGGDDLEAYDLNRRGGSLFSGPSYSAQNFRETEQTRAVNEAFLSIRTGTVQMAKDLGLATTQVEGFTMSVGDVKVHPDIDKLGLVLDGLSDQEKLAKIEEVLQKSGNAMAELVLGAGATAQQLAQLYATVMQERAGLENQLLQLQGNTVEIRRRERDALHESNRAIYDQIKALEDQKTANEDAAEAIAKAAEAQRNALQTARNNTDAAYAALDRAVNAQKRAATVTRDVAQQQVSSIKSIMDVLEGGIRNLFQGTREAAFQGMSFIDRALSTARTTGYLPDAQELQQAITGATQGVSGRTYATKADQIEAQRLLAFKLKDLQDIAGTQLTEAERQLEIANKQLESLDAILENARAQIDALRGVDNSVMSVEAAINRLADAILAEQTLTTPINSNNYLASNPDVKAAFEKNNYGLATSDQQAAVHFGLHGRNEGRSYSSSAASSYLSANADVLSAYNSNNFGMSADEFAAYHFANYGRFEGRAFANGGFHTGGMRLVGEYGPELEATGPARYYSASQTQSMLGGGVVDEIKGLREEVSMLRAEARATAVNTGRTQDIMKRVTRNGESMIVATDGEALEVTS